MAFTATQTDLAKLTVAMFGAVPGGFMTALEEVYAASGNNLAAAANLISTLDSFTALYTGTNAEKAATMAARYGLDSTTTDGAAAIQYFTESLDAGVNMGELFAAANAYLAANPTSFTTAQDTLANKVAVAEYYADAGLDSTDLATLQAQIASVTADDATVTAAQTSIDALVAEAASNAATPMTFTLTYGVDTGSAFTGGIGHDTFNADPALITDPATGTQNVVDTIHSLDVLAGGEGTDTLNVVSGLATTNAAPVMTGIENVNIQFKAASTISLANATGVTTVRVHESTAGATVAGVKSANIVLDTETQAIVFNGSTATALNVTATNVNDGAATPGVQVVEVNSAAADTATSLVLNVSNSMIDVDSTNNDAYTAVSIAATGTNTVTLTDVAGVATSLAVTGAGSVDVSGAALTKVATVTAADGGLKADMTANTATTLTVTTGAGVDTLTATGANLTSLNSGAGNDVITITSALAATSTVNAGTGNDTVTLNAAPTAGATIAGGEGTDTIAMAKADYATVSAFTTAQKALISGFETLQITDNLTAAGGPYVVSTLTGVTNFVAAAGVTNAETSAVTGLGANSTVTLKGTATATGVLSVALTDATGSADAITLVASNTYTENNDTTADARATAVSFTATGIENVTIQSTGVASAAVTGTNVADVLTNTITLVDNDIKSLTVTGDKIASITTAAGMTALATIDASANTAGVTLNGSNATTIGMTIKGSATAANTLTGTDFADTITGGSARDTITGGVKGDTLTGNGGNDVFSLAADDSSIGAGLFDTITDFVANTYGQGTNGAVTVAGAITTVANLTGDTISIAGAGNNSGGILVDVFTNAADATTYLANNFATHTTVAALDSTNNNLYIDNTADGVADFYIHLTGVTTLDAAAFVLV